MNMFEAVAPRRDEMENLAEARIRYPILHQGMLPVSDAMRHRFVHRSEPTTEKDTVRNMIESDIRL